MMIPGGSGDVYQCVERNSCNALQWHPSFNTERYCPWLPKSKEPSQRIGKNRSSRNVLHKRRLPATFPGLEVAGVGPIALPLEAHQATAIKKKSRQAPYGKGTLTLVDTDVRRVWEIDADQIALANPEWPAVLGRVVATVQSELGLEKQKLDAHLYKLLLYEPGSFFLRIKTAKSWIAWSPPS